MMSYCKNIEVALLLTLIQFASTSSELSVDNDTDCAERYYDEECSGYPLVGECNVTTGVCSCETYNGTGNLDCFYYDSATNFCKLKKCWRFSNGSGECSQNLRSNGIAILLTILFINFGAANFYIECYELVVLFLGLLQCGFQFGSCALARKKDDGVSTLCLFCCSANTFLSLLFFAWWLADFVIFVQGTRNDGDGVHSNELLNFYPPV